VLARVPSAPTRVRRAIVVALASVPVVCALTLWGDLVVGGAPWCSGFPPLGPTLLLLLVGVNALRGRARPGAWLGGGTVIQRDYACACSGSVGTAWTGNAKSER
jgi:hypothetical protein